MCQHNHVAKVTSLLGSLLLHVEMADSAELAGPMICDISTSPSRAISVLDKGFKIQLLTNENDTTKLRFQLQFGIP